MPGSGFCARNSRLTYELAVTPNVRHMGWLPACPHYTLSHVCCNLWYAYSHSYFQHGHADLHISPVLGNALTLICAAVPAGEALDPILAMRIGIPFWLLSIVLNILTTLIVAYRLLAHRRALLQLGVLPHDAARFASVVGILSESAGLYSAAGLIYLPHFVLNTSWSGPLSSLFAGMSVSVISTMHICV